MHSPPAGSSSIKPVSLSRTQTPYLATKNLEPLPIPKPCPNPTHLRTDFLHRCPDVTVPRSKTLKDKPDVHRWMDEQINKIWYIHSTEYFSAFKKEGHSNTYCELDKPWKYYAVQNKPVTKGQIFVWFHLYEALRTSSTQKVEWWLPGPGVEGRGVEYLMLTGDRVSVSKVDGGDVCTIMWTYSMTLNWAL